VSSEDKTGTFHFFTFHRKLILMYDDTQALESGLSIKTQVRVWATFLSF
jgi:hypothetical protein